VVETTKEEAARCPECQEPGVRINIRNAPQGDFPPGTKVELFECRNDSRCPAYLPAQSAGPTRIPADRNRWAIQINPDGTIPPKNVSRGQPKNYLEVSPHSGAAQQARDSLAYMAAKDEMGDGREAYEIGKDIGYL
jgi:hypothetical protein